MDLAAILNHLRPGAQWTLNGDEYKGLEWIGPGKAPSEKECAETWETIKTEIERRPIQQARQQAFAREADPLFFAWQRNEIDQQTWLDKVAEIRARHPYSD